MTSWTLSDVIGFTTLILGLMGGFFYAIFNLLTNHKASRDEFIGWLKNGTLHTKYHKITSSFLNKVQNFYGDPLSFKAFDRCLIISLVYPILFFEVGYSFFGGNHTFAGIEIFPENSNWKGLFFILSLTYILILVFLRVLLARSKLTKKYTIPFAIMTSIVIGNLLHAVDLNGFDANIDVVITVVVITGFVILYVDSTVGTGVIFIYICSVAAIVFYLIFEFAEKVNISVTDQISTFSIFVLFSIFFPLINALLDWLSWVVSRRFIILAINEKEGLKIVGDIVADLILAIFFMIALCALLPAGIELSELIFSSIAETNLDWSALALDARDDPWGEGIMITLMLVTTLIPTFLHVFFGVLALVIHGFGGKTLAAYLSTADENGSHRVPFVSAIWIEAYGISVIAGMVGTIYLILRLPEFHLAERLYCITAFLHGL